MDMSALLNTPPSGPLSTTVKVPREGEVRAMIDDGEKWITFRDGDSSKNLSPQAVILFNVLDDGIRKDLGREKVLVAKTIWLDLTSSGQIDSSEGKNVELGRLMEAAGTQGQPLSALRGKGPFLAKISHRSDKNDPTIKYAEIKKVAKLS